MQDINRDANLTDFGKATLKDRYLLEGEGYQGLFERVATAYGSNDAHASRLYDYMSKLWFMPATPVLSNGGTTRGLPISCFLNEAGDNMGDIVNNWVENVWLACKGGGIGSYWGNVRAIGENIGKIGKSSGVIPFMKVQDSMTLAVSQGALRRASSALYLPVWHPEIEEFVDIRRPTGGDPNRKCLNLNHGIVIDDAFMEAVKADKPYGLRSPKTGEILSMVNARALWIRILIARVETGEPYLLFIDHVNRALPDWQTQLGYKIKTSNLCSEIVLNTGVDHRGINRTAVCCLSSLNLETFDEWKENELFIRDILEFLDNVLESFIQMAGPEHASAVYAAQRERSVGLGVMGLHGYFQSLDIPFDSKAAQVLNLQIFKHIQTKVNEADLTLGQERGPCPDAIDAGVGHRFANKMAIAPTASISIICGGASAGIEPSAANIYTHKTLSGSFPVRNKYLSSLLAKHGKNVESVWKQILSNGGSVQALDFLNEHEKAVFRTAPEIDQESIIRLAADRAPYIDQAQSVNIFVPADISKKTLHRLHFLAWELGLKSLYYCRSKSLKRPDDLSQKVERQVINTAPQSETCESCQ